jgi:hypothetical protein
VKKNQESVKSIGNTIKSNTPTRRVSKEREAEMLREEIASKTVHILGRIQIPSFRKSKYSNQDQLKDTNIIKIAKVKDRVLKATGEEREVRLPAKHEALSSNPNATPPHTKFLH